MDHSRFKTGELPPVLNALLIAPTHAHQMFLSTRSSLLPKTQADLRNRPRSTLYRARIRRPCRLIKLAKVLLCLLVYTIFVFYFDLILEAFASTFPHPVNWFPTHTPFPVEAATAIGQNPRVLILQY
jgi:hypothetical protein